MLPASWRRSFWGNAPRLCLLASLVLCWANYLLTERWAHVPGSVHGAKEPVFLLALTLVTTLACVVPVGRAVRAPWVALACCAGGLAFLAFAFFTWFPAHSWSQIPFLDNWPARYQATIDQIALLRRGAIVGWQWAFLGGYQLSSDLTVSLAALAFVPVTLFGPQAGFHLLHLLMFFALPLLVWVDLRHDPRPDLKWFAAGLTAVFATNYSYFLLRSGDTNSLGGVVTTAMALVAAGRLGQSRWAGPVLVAALTLVTYSHAGFMLFACIFLAIDVAVTRQWRRGGAIAIAVTAALVAGLPLTWESWRYPEFFTLNNAVLVQPPFDAADFARKVFYNTELLVLPGRWFNDYTGLAAILLPVLALVAVKGQGRPRLHACWALAAILLVRFYHPQLLGLGLLRPIHMHVVFLAPVIAFFIASWGGHRALAVSLPLACALYIQVLLVPIPHVTSVRDFNPVLIHRIASLGGALVLVENSYHAEMDQDPARKSPPTPFSVHFEALLPPLTGQRFYAGVWDGWQWSPARKHLLANGALGGRRIDDLDDDEILTELRRWGIAHLVVWSEGTARRLERLPQARARWAHGRWTHFELVDADARSVVVPRGTGTLADWNPLSARVVLEQVVESDVVVVRTNHYPAWRASHEGRDLSIFAVEGQLAFRAPASGDYVVSLEYPRYWWTLVLAIAAVIGASALLLAMSSRRANGLVQAPSYGSGNAT